MPFSRTHIQKSQSAANTHWITKGDDRPMRRWRWIYGPGFEAVQRYVEYVQHWFSRKKISAMHITGCSADFVQDGTRNPGNPGPSITFGVDGNTSLELAAAGIMMKVELFTFLMWHARKGLSYVCIMRSKMVRSRRTKTMSTGLTNMPSDGSETHWSSISPPISLMTARLNVLTKIPS